MMVCMGIARTSHPHLLFLIPLGSAARSPVGPGGT